MPKTENPVVQRFRRHEARIKELMKNQREFASICRDYEEIVAEIGRLKQSIDPDAKVLTDLHHLQLDLEQDIRDWLNSTSNTSTASE